MKGHFPIGIWEVSPFSALIEIKEQYRLVGTSGCRGARPRELLPNLVLLDEVGLSEETLLASTGGFWCACA